MVQPDKEDSSSAEDTPVLLVGWDGAPFHLISDMINDGHLPTLRDISKSGYFGPLETVPYVMSSCAWSTFLTGKNAGKHGVFDFYSNEFKNGTYFREPIDRTARDATDMMEVLNSHGLTMGQINVPLTFPAQEIDEFTIAGMITPDTDADRFTHPKDFLDDYEELDEYKIDIGEGKKADRDLFLNAVEETVDNRMELTLYSIERADNPDVFFVVFTSPDRLSHYYYHFYDEKHPFRVNESEEDLEQYADVLPDLYRDLDDKLETLIHEIKESYGSDPLVAVLSDHGMTSIKRIFHVNKWLSREGYLTFTDDEEDLNNEIAEELNDRVEYIFGKVDWDETTAYAMGRRGAIYVNLEGREPEGIVPPEEYDQIVASLIEDLHDVVDSEMDQEVVEAIHTRDELFHGEHVEKAPDLLVELEEGYYPFGYAFNRDSADLFSTNDWPELPFATAIEDKPGILAISGPKIRDDSDTVDIGLADIAPTLYQYLALPVPRDIDGRVVKELFDEDLAGEDAVTYGPPVDEHEIEEEGETSDSKKEAVKDRLKDLGYL